MTYQIHYHHPNRAPDTVAERVTSIANAKRLAGTLLPPPGPHRPTTIKIHTNNDWKAVTVGTVHPTRNTITWTTGATPPATPPPAPAPAPAPVRRRPAPRARTPATQPAGPVPAAVDEGHQLSLLDGLERLA